MKCDWCLPVLLIRGARHSHAFVSPQALAFVAKALDPDSSVGGDSNRWVHTLAYRCRGRILAKQGPQSDAAAAEEALEAACRSAQECQYHLRDISMATEILDWLRIAYVFES
eukprot:COSAG01_NODE_1501_length_10094_cov_5.987113_3_plen_112_part_00